MNNEIIKEIGERLRSPIVKIQLISIIGSAIVLLIPNSADVVDVLTVAASSLINIFAGLNNPANKDRF